MPIFEEIDLLQRVLPLIPEESVISVSRFGNLYRDLSHPIYQMLRRLSEYRQLAEEKRLLYVALTRAQDHLVLLGEKTDGESYSSWLRDAGSDDLAEVPGELEQRLQDWLKGDTHEDVPAEAPPDRISPRQLQKPSSEAGATHRGPSRSPLQKRIWSPTQLTEWVVGTVQIQDDLAGTSQGAHITA